LGTTGEQASSRVKGWDQESSAPKHAETASFCVTRSGRLPARPGAFCLGKAVDAACVVFHLFSGQAWRGDDCARRVVEAKIRLFFERQRKAAQKVAWLALCI